MQATFTKILIICAVCYALCVIIYVSIYLTNPPFSYRKRAAAILERYAMDPKTASFSSATSLGAASMEVNHKRTVQLQEAVWGILTPSKFNGTWISDSDIMYKDEDGGITVLNLENNFSYQVLQIYKILQ